MTSSNAWVVVLGMVGLAAAVGLLFWVRVLDPDVLMHLKTGDWILRHRAIPKTDLFSANAAGMPWTTHEWLWEVLTYAVYRAGDWKALYAVRLLLVAGALVACAWAARLGGASVAASIAACVLAVGPLASMAEIRPQLVSELFFAVVVFGVQALAWAGRAIPGIDEQSDPPTLKPLLQTILLPPLFMVWANLHGAVLLGYVVLGCAVMDAAIRNRPAVKWICITLVLCILAAMLNPHGYELFLFPFKVVGQESFRAQIYEWSRPDFTVPFRPFWAFAGIALLVAATAWRRISIFHWLMILGFLAAAVMSRRQIPFFALAAIGPVALGIEGLIAHIRLPDRKRWLAHFAVLLLTCVMIPFSMTCYASAGHKLGMGLAKDRFPDVASNRLAHLHTDGTLLNDYNDGGFLIWRLYPEWPVTMDGRVDVYGPKLVQQYERVWAGAAGWEDTLAKWRVQAIVGRFEITRALPRDNLYHKLAGNPDWALVYWDEVSQLFLRRGTTLDASGIKPFRVLAPGLTLQQMAAKLSSNDDWLALGADLRRSVSEVPENRRAAALLKQYESAVKR